MARPGCGDGRGELSQAGPRAERRPGLPDLVSPRRQTRARPVQRSYLAGAVIDHGTSPLQGISCPYCASSSVGPAPSRLRRRCSPSRTRLRARPGRSPSAASSSTRPVTRLPAPRSGTGTASTTSWATTPSTATVPTRVPGPSRSPPPARLVSSPSRARPTPGFMPWTPPAGTSNSYLSSSDSAMHVVLRLRPVRAAPDLRARHGPRPRRRAVAGCRDLGPGRPQAADGLCAPWVGWTYRAPSRAPTALS